LGGETIIKVVLIIIEATRFRYSLIDFRLLFIRYIRIMRNIIIVMVVFSVNARVNVLKFILFAYNEFLKIYVGVPKGEYGT
jgi:hypothetical protein